jgi:hypothetical protein
MIIYILCHNIAHSDLCFLCPNSVTISYSALFSANVLVDVFGLNSEEEEGGKGAFGYMGTRPTEKLGRHLRILCCVGYSIFSWSRITSVVVFVGTLLRLPYLTIALSLVK